MSISGAILFTVVFSSASFSLQAQTKGQWQRVYTGEDSVIEVNVSSSTLESNHLLRADFRTVLSKPEKIAGNQGAKYKTRIETIRFKLDENRYRLCETTWFDSKGAKLHSYTPTAEDWRVAKEGGVMDRLSNAVRALPPFGSWKVVAYQFAEGGSTPAPEPSLQKLLGSRVRFQADKAEVGVKVCSSLAYEDKRVSNEELDKELGVRLESIGINSKYAETTKLRCEADGWTPPQSLLVKLKKGEMLMLWNGVFLVLKREREWTGNILPPLKRARG